MSYNSYEMKGDRERGFREFWAEERARAAKKGKLAEFDAWGERFRIARLLCQRRLDCGLSQKELARRTGIAQTEISRLERGEGNPTLRTLSTIANAMEGRLTLEFHAQPRRAKKLESAKKRAGTTLKSLFVELGEHEEVESIARSKLVRSKRRSRRPKAGRKPR